ncbi:unnamed protein product, partial [Anisakis simplex]|uniref:Cation_ATPase_N domain-containing protein n=1 Tax=Anisakis simplex TaxID=6269 RepID=A0A0M3JAD8_ANISI
MEARGTEAVDKLNAEYGGAEELCRMLKVDPLHGLPNDLQQLTKRRAKFGSNTIPPAKSKSFFHLIFDACKDPTLVILLVAGFISLGLSFYEPGQVVQGQQNATNILSSANANHTLEGLIGLSNSTFRIDEPTSANEDHGSAWIEGVAILICVVVVVLVTAINDFSKER